MKKLLLFLTVLLFVTAANAQKHRKYLIKDKYKVVYRDTTSLTDLVSNSLEQTYYSTDSCLYLAPAINMTVYMVNKTESKSAALPGIGYGINYKPDNCKLDCSSLVGLNVFANIGVAITDEVNFVGAISPVFTFYDSLFTGGAMYDFNTRTWYYVFGTSFEF